MRRPDCYANPSWRRADLVAAQVPKVIVMAVNLAAEAVNAKEWWGSTTAQAKEYGQDPPMYAASLAHLIRRLAPDSVLEMGCNAGRNLELLRRCLPTATSIRGFDINQQSIEYGRATWGLDLDVADEEYLSRMADGSVDLAFTVSVLDHLPDIRDTLLELARVVRYYYVAVEPHPQEDLPYLDVFISDGRLRSSIDTTTPYSYAHPYNALVPEAGLTAVLDLPMPTTRGLFGPLYRLTVWARPGAPAPIPWMQLRDELIFGAVAHSLPGGFDVAGLNHRRNE
jgi:SAM-dependent methyltransferase